uniref:Uncharacterized protein n=1 Tax=Peromyscus maniculatus bairdii TaxID=230844 RepID=A0A8C8UMU5_PERMB
MANTVGMLKKITGLVGPAICNTPRHRLPMLHTKPLMFLINSLEIHHLEQIINEKLGMLRAEPILFSMV